MSWDALPTEIQCLIFTEISKLFSNFERLDRQAQINTWDMILNCLLVSRMFEFQLWAQKLELILRYLPVVVTSLTLRLKVHGTSSYSKPSSEIAPQKIFYIGQTKHSL